ncbi:MAG TPA: hypothetical protein VFI08_04845, partial [Spirochaetia bacterium]|nr:hypothetical protein [Spirochaetia bacterium]
MKKAAWFGAGAALLVALLGCQTTKPALTAPAESAVQVEKNGFSPSGPAGENSLEISLLFGNSDSISSWKLDVASGSAPAVKSWTGTASYLPASLTWDGKDDSGSLAPEGTYTAKLSVTYKQKFQPGSAESRSFILDVAPPTGTITADPAVVVPTDAGVQAPVTLSIDAHSATAKMDSWSLDVLDTAGALVKSWTGQWPNPSATWDGSTMDGGHVRPDSTYSMVATVRDEFGNSAQIKSSLTVAALPPGSSAMATQPPAAPPAPPAKPGQPSIAASTLGFSPNGDHVADTLSLVVGWGQPSSVASWKASVTFRDGTVEKTWSGDGKNLPSSLTWDGKTDSGSMAPEGTYTASLSVNYGTAFAAGNATSPSFILDITPPSGTISLSSPLFSPIESSDTITLKLAATSPTAKIDSWEVDIYDPGGNVFRSLSEKWPQDSIVWNGRNSTGELVQSAEDYPVVARVRDEFGNVGMVKSVVPVDILVE